MKKIYWRPHRVSRLELAVIALLALAGVFAVERFLVREQQPMYKEKLEAAHLSRNAMAAIKAERLRRNLKIDPETDPTESGLIGELMTPLTTNTGHITAKQTSINPNFAAVIVDFLRRAGVKEGDTVACGFSGSFPAMNIHTLAAITAMKARPVAVTSAAGSQWGANIPGLLWIDMEKILFEKEIFAFRSVAASRGGVDDRALGLSKQGKQMLDDAIDRAGLIAIKEASYAESLERRMQIYEEYAAGAPIKAYVNVGGGAISVGTAAGKRMFKPGLNRTAPSGAPLVDSVIGRFALRGVPVIHLVNIDQIADRYGLPKQPTTTPAIGEGKIYYKLVYHPWLPWVVLGGIVLAMVGFIRTDWGFRLLKTGGTPKKRQRPEPMI